MKKVLILSPWFPPCNDVGSRRVGCFAKYLPRYGWQPLVITKRWTPENCCYDLDFVKGLSRDCVVAEVEDNEHLATGYQLLKRKFQCACAPHRHPQRWTASVADLLPRVLAEHRVDAVWATAPTPGPLFVAGLCRSRYGLSWVADFRDVLGQQGEPRGLLNRFRYRMALSGELTVLASASVITTVSAGLAEILRRRHSQRVDVITNGFDPEAMAGRNSQATGKFTIAYAGNAPRNFNLRPFFAGVARLIAAGVIDASTIRLDFYGEGDPKYLDGHLAGYPYRSTVRRFPRVPHADLMSALGQATVLLQPAEPGSKGLLSGKIFDYLAAQRPVLVVPSDHDCLDTLVSETGAGRSCSTADEVAHAVHEWYEEWRSRGTVAHAARRASVMRFSHHTLAGQLAQVLDEVSSRSNRDPAAPSKCVAT